MPDPNLTSFGQPLVAAHYGVTRDTTCEYGCVRCQKWHTFGDDLFGPHLAWQSKHGTRTRPLTPAEIILCDFREAMKV